MHTSHFQTVSKKVTDYPLIKQLNQWAGDGMLPNCVTDYKHFVRCSSAFLEERQTAKKRWPERQGKTQQPILPPNSA